MYFYVQKIEVLCNFVYFAIRQRSTVEEDCVYVIQRQIEGGLLCRWLSPVIILSTMSLPVSPLQCFPPLLNFQIALYLWTDFSADIEQTCYNEIKSTFKRHKSNPFVDPPTTTSSTHHTQRCKYPTERVTYRGNRVLTGSGYNMKNETDPCRCLCFYTSFFKAKVGSYTIHRCLITKLFFSF